MLKLLAVKRSFLHMEVKFGNGRTWMLTAIYASPYHSAKRFLWEQLDELDVRWPWMLIGDFKYVLKDEERSSGVGASTSFQSWVSGRGDLSIWGM